MVHRIIWRVASAAALDFWNERLSARGVAVGREGESVVFVDPDGLVHELVVYDGHEPLLCADHPEIPPEHAIAGFHGARSYAVDLDRSTALLRELGFVETGEYGAWCVGTDERSALWYVDPAPATRRVEGAGTLRRFWPARRP